MSESKTEIPVRTYTPGDGNTPTNLDGNPIGGGPWIRVDGLKCRHWPSMFEDFTPSPDCGKHYDIEQRQGHAFLVAWIDKVREKAIPYNKEEKDWKKWRHGAVSLEYNEENRKRLEARGYEPCQRLLDEDRNNIFQFSPLPHQAGQYNINNSMIAACGLNGEIYVTPYSESAMAALKRAKYQEGDLWVPLSNGEQPEDPAAKKEFSRLKKLAFSRKENRALDNISVDVTGAYFTRPTTIYVEKVPENNNKIGSYNISETGIIAFVNAEGQTRIASLTVLPEQNNRLRKPLPELLEEIGFRRDLTVEIPFAYDQHPVKNPHPHVTTRKELIAQLDQPLQPDTKLAQALAPMRDTWVYKSEIRKIEQKWQEALAELDDPNGPKTSRLPRVTDRQR